MRVDWRTDSIHTWLIAEVYVILVSTTLAVDGLILTFALDDDDDDDDDDAYEYRWRKKQS